MLDQDEGQVRGGREGAEKLGRRLEPAGAEYTPLESPRRDVGGGLVVVTVRFAPRWRTAPQSGIFRSAMNQFVGLDSTWDLSRHIGALTEYRSLAS
jgi:hypothetical protein